MVFGRSREAFPTQILVNEYVENFGISSHFEDEDAFGDVIATVGVTPRHARCISCDAMLHHPR